MNVLLLRQFRPSLSFSLSICQFSLSTNTTSLINQALARSSLSSMHSIESGRGQSRARERQEAGRQGMEGEEKRKHERQTHILHLALSEMATENYSSFVFHRKHTKVDT